LSESKLTYIALVLAVGALAVSAGTSVLSVLPNGGKLAQLSHEVEQLYAEREKLQLMVNAIKDNRGRIDELDAGLTAIASVADLDQDKLIAAMNQAKQDAPVADSSDLNMTLESSVTVATGGAEEVEAEPAPAWAVVPEPATPLEIAQVDNILSKRISENWFQPANVKDDLSAIIMLKMTRDGKVASVKMAKASGNKIFDNSVITAVKSIEAIDEVKRLSDADYQKAYASRSIQFTPQMGK